MKYLDISKLKNVISCRIFDEAYNRNMGIALEHYNTPHALKFENDLAIARVIVEAVDFYNSKHQYVTYTIIKEIRNKDTDEVEDYELVNQEDSRFRLPRFVEGITRTSNHFFFEVLAGIEEETLTNFWHYEYDEKTKSFTLIGKLEGKPTITKNPDLVILNDSQLYSLSRKQLIGSKYTSIEDCNGKRFLVVDHITTKNPSSLNNILMFDIDEYGNKTSKVFSRNIKTFTDDDLSTPYEEIRQKEIQILEDTLAEEEKYKMLMKLASGYEQ